MRKLVAQGLLLMVLAALPIAAQAQLAYAAKDVHLRAGPAREYPVVAIVPAGFEVTVLGCLSDYSWCDVIAGPSRGWVYAGNISYAYQGAYVPVLDYGAQIGIAVVAFILLDYWTVHYHDRPFYRDRDRWVHRPRPPRPIGPVAPPRPPPQHDLPGGPRQQPPHPGASGGQVPRPPQQGAPIKQHPRPPQPGTPGAQQVRPPQHGAPSGSRPQPPQRGGPSGQVPRSPER